MNTTDYFATDYFAARERFSALAQSHGYQLESFPIQASGPSGERLSIDVAYSGTDHPQNLLIISSGTHGVEGFAGSAFQQLFVNEFPPPTGTSAVLLVHAINPYGFAHLRRANENNVDINRNALEHFPGPPNVPYRELNAWLNRPSPPVRGDLFLLRALPFVLRLGRAGLKQAIAAGQYEFPQGVFYGGDAKQESTKIFESIMQNARWAAVKRALHLDLHTGLGRAGTYKLLVDYADGSREFKQLQNWFGPGQVAGNRPEASPAYEVSGPLVDITARVFSGKEVFSGVLEFGTYGLPRMLRALCRENRARYFADNKTIMEESRTELREVFFPASRRWRTSVLDHARRIFAQALAALH